MKKYLVVIFLFASGIPSIQGLEAQSYACNSNGNTHSPLDTYWHYRYRLIHYFMRMGSKQGMSIPADSRNGDENVSTPQDMLSWVDGPRVLSWYIETLATEYYLLSHNNQNTDETVMELYYALHALFRMDSTLVAISMGGPSGNCSICGGNISSINFPGYGIMPSDDVGSYVPIALTDPLNAGLTTTVTRNSQTYLATAYTGTTDPCGLNWHANLFVGASAFGIPVVPEGLPVSELGDGIVGPIDELLGTGITPVSVTSQDNFMATLIALATVKTLVPQNVFGFSACTNPNGPYGYNLGPYQMAQKLGTAILSYIWVSQLTLVGCDGNKLFPDITQSAFTKYWMWPYYPPLVNVSSFFNFIPPPPVAYLPPLFQAFIVPAVLATPFLVNPSVIWDNYTPCTALDLSSDGSYCDETTMELAQMGAVMGNDGGPYNSACAMISAFGTWDQGCAFCAGAGSNATTTGQDMYYGALYNILWGGNCSTVDICHMLALINSAPWEGPYNHCSSNSEITKGCPDDFAQCGWASSRRFASNDNNDYNLLTNNAAPGNFNGLDYMLFYNLYCIMSQRVGQTVYVPTGCTYPEEYPTNNPPCWAGNLGTTGNPFAISTINCAPIIVNQLNVDPGGGLVIEGGNISYIDMKPTSGNIIISSGSYFEAACPIICCEPNPNSYLFEKDLGVDNDRDPKRRIDSSADNYHMNSEFAPKPTYDAISNYPNPFNNQTTFNFEIKETTSVTISIFDMHGVKVADVFVNQKYTQGSYAKVFDGSNLAAGTYIAVMTTQDDKKTVKIIKT